MPDSGSQHSNVGQGILTAGITSRPKVLGQMILLILNLQEKIVFHVSCTKVTMDNKLY